MATNSPISTSTSGDNPTPPLNPPESDRTGSESSDLSDDDIPSGLPSDWQSEIRDAFKVRRSARQPKRITRYTDESLVHNNTRRRVSLPSPVSSPPLSYRRPRGVLGSILNCSPHRSKLDSFLRDCKRMDAKGEELQEMREKVVSGNAAADPEMLNYKKVAEGEAAMNQKETIAFIKYSKPLPFFSIDVSPFPTLVHAMEYGKLLKNGEVSRTGCEQICPLTNILAQTLNNHSAIPFVSQFLQSCFANRPDAISRSVVRMLFHSCVWDPTFVDINSYDREPLTDTLIAAVRSQKSSSEIWKQSSVWSLRLVLLVNGAVFDGLGGENENSFESSGNLEDGDDDDKFEAVQGTDADLVCLDDALRKRRDISQNASIDHLKSTEAQICNPSDENENIPLQSEYKKKIIDRARRNIARFLRIAAALVECNWNIKHVIDGEESDDDELMQVDTMDEDMVVRSVKLCVCLLLSRFGSGLKRDVGPLMQALVQRVPQEKWPVVRWQIAQAVLQLTSRLSLHVELGTYLFPFSCSRCLGLSLDICYLSMYQWCSGPNLDPRPRVVSEVNAPVEGSGTEVSFGLTNVVDLAEEIPDMTKDSDVLWACGVTRLLKQMVTMPVVLRQRGAGDCARLDKLVQKLRRGQGRLDKFGAEAHDMRIALDTLGKAVRDMCELTPRGSLQTKLNLASAPSFDAGFATSFCDTLNNEL